MISRITLIVLYPFYISLVSKPNPNFLDMNPVVLKLYLLFSQLVSIYYLTSQIGFLNWVLFVNSTFGLILWYFSRYWLNDTNQTKPTTETNPETNPDKKLITTGPYHYIMHPIFLSEILILTGAVIFFHFNWIVTMVLLGYIGFYYYEKICQEEISMLNLYGYKYNSYIQNKSRFIPYFPKIYSHQLLPNQALSHQRFNNRSEHISHIE